MKLNLKARKETYAPNMTQQEIADAISDDKQKISRRDLNLVLNGTAPAEPRFNIIRNRLEKFFIEKEKEVT